MKKTFFISVFLLILIAVKGQDQPVKIRHAEPLYIDLIRDLGARKGEKEWNIGTSLNSRSSAAACSGFAEYEFAPLNRLGFEVEVPFTIYRSTPADGSGSGHNKIEGIKTAVQYTFLVSPAINMSVAVGYIHELGLHSFYTAHKEHSMLKSTSHNPICIIAKRWGSNWHSMLYAGPVFEKELKGSRQDFLFQTNLSMHYVLPGTSHFIGLEVNHEYNANGSSTVLRPQTKLKLSPSVALGLVTGIPASFKNEDISFMFRIIYEPRNKTQK